MIQVAKRFSKSETRDDIHGEEGGNLGELQMSTRTGVPVSHDAEQRTKLLVHAYLHVQNLAAGIAVGDTGLVLGMGRGLLLREHVVIVRIDAATCVPSAAVVAAALLVDSADDLRVARDELIWPDPDQLVLAVKLAMHPVLAPAVCGLGYP